MRRFASAPPGDGRATSIGATSRPQAVPDGARRRALRWSRRRRWRAWRLYHVAWDAKTRRSRAHTFTRILGASDAVRATASLARRRHARARRVTPRATRAKLEALASRRAAEFDDHLAPSADAGSRRATAAVADARILQEHAATPSASPTTRCRHARQPARALAVARWRLRPCAHRGGDLRRTRTSIAAVALGCEFSLRDGDARVEVDGGRLADRRSDNSWPRGSQCAAQNAASRWCRIDVRDTTCTHGSRRSCCARALMRRTPRAQSISRRGRAASTSAPRMTPAMRTSSRGASRARRRGGRSPTAARTRSRSSRSTASERPLVRGGERRSASRRRPRAPRRCTTRGSRTSGRRRGRRGRA